MAKRANIFFIFLDKIFLKKNPSHDICFLFEVHFPGILILVLGTSLGSLGTSESMALVTVVLN